MLEYYLIKEGIPMTNSRNFITVAVATITQFTAFLLSVKANNSSMRYLNRKNRANYCPTDSNLKVTIGIILMTLSACATQEGKHNTKAIPTPEKPPMTKTLPPMPGLNPPMTLVKAGKTLNLVRVMDGAICKNEFEGAKGAFLLYADPNDIKRIKREKSANVFYEFEGKIQHIASEALQEAAQATNLSEDPFALGSDEAQEKLAKQLANNFRNAVMDNLKIFKKETTLTIDISAFQPSFVFYQKGCEVTRMDPETQNGASPFAK
jgi:hypothetical protein